MKTLFRIQLFFLLTLTFFSVPMLPGIATTAKASNDYPIIFVHGFGWGFGDSVLGIEYWGGVESIIDDLENQGHEVYSVNVSPFASNWDRACQLYASIKGGTVDFGKAHSQEYGHDRYGKNYDGVYPEWDEQNKVHLVGHSMGGQTIRVLVQLLEEGSSEEQQASSDTSPLFSGYLNGWVQSVTSISTPHDGTLVADDLNEFLPFVEDMVIWTSRYLDSDKFINFGLDHWDLQKHDDETIAEYYDRLFSSSVWDTEDISAYDLSTSGAADLNSWVEIQSNVYYFSISNSATFEGPLTGYHYPSPRMNPLLWPTANLMGTASDSDWRENDGVVSVESQTHPSVNTNDQKIRYYGAPYKGVWNHMGKESRYGHLGIVGLFQKTPHNLYREHANLLSNLGGDAPDATEKVVFYKIKNRNTGKCVDVEYASTDNEANVHQWNYHGGDNQLWKMEKVLTDANDVDYYKIINLNSGKCLDVEGWSTDDAGNIHQYEYKGQKNQQWQIKQIDDSPYVKLINRYSGKCLDVAYGSTSDGANIQQWHYEGKNQQWELVPELELEQDVSDKETYYLIKNRRSGKCVDVSDASIDNAANVQQWGHTPYGHENQLWKLEKVDTGDKGEAYYKIINLNSGKCLDVEGWSIDDAGNIHQYEYKGQKNQQWQIKQIDDSPYVKIINRYSGKCLDVAYDSTDDGANIQQWPYEGEGQQWKLIPKEELEEGEPEKEKYYLLRNRNTEKIVDVEYASTDDGANVHQWHYNPDGYENQLWNIEKVATGDNGEVYYKFIALHSGKCFEVKDYLTDNGANVQQYTYIGGYKDQQWRIIPINDSPYVKIINRNSGKALDVAYASTEDGANIQQWLYEGENQQWELLLKMEK